MSRYSRGTVQDEGVPVIARVTGDIQEVNEDFSPYCNDLSDQEI